MTYGVNPEIRNRIRVAVASYAYEMMSDPIMSDEEFDRLAELIDPRIPTGNERMDEFFRTDFVSFSGVWVHNHPDIKGLERIYRMLKNQKSYDQKNNRDLFGPILIKRPTPFRACSRCGKNTAVPITSPGACCC